MNLAQKNPSIALLLETSRDFADAHANRFGEAVTDVPGLSIVRSTFPGRLQVAINKPLIAILLQGRKRVTSGPDTYEYGPGEALVISADAPTQSQITKASPAAPYYALVFEFDPVILRDLMTDGSVDAVQASPIKIEPVDAKVADAALRLMRLLEQPKALFALRSGILRELHYWLLESRHGSAITRLGTEQSQADRIGRVIRVLRQQYGQTLRIETLARLAGMSEASFHKHFRAITTLSPLQFQKQLRLIEARRLMLASGETITNAAYAVGYLSVPQFTREYSRLFGAPPRRDIQLSGGSCN